MAVQTYKLGPGELIIGSGPGQNISCQITKAGIEWDKDSGDSVTVLCGDTVAGDTTYTAKLTGTMYQDISASGFLTWSWANKGTEQPFEFIPNTVSARKVTGTLVVDPLNLGGDVATKPTSDFELDIVGTPVIATVT